MPRASPRPLIEMNTAEQDKDLTKVNDKEYVMLMDAKKITIHFLDILQSEESLREFDPRTRNPRPITIEEQIFFSNVYPIAVYCMISILDLVDLTYKYCEHNVSASDERFDAVKDRYYSLKDYRVMPENDPERESKLQFMYMLRDFNPLDYVQSILFHRIFRSYSAPFHLKRYFISQIHFPPSFDFPVGSDLQQAYCALVLKQRDVSALTLPHISAYRKHIYYTILVSEPFTEMNLKEERDDFDEMKVILRNEALYVRMNAFCIANHLCHFCGRTLEEGQRFNCTKNPDYIYCNANHHILDLKYHEGHARAAAAAPSAAAAPPAAAPSAAAASDEPTERVAKLEEAPEVVAGSTGKCDFATCQVMLSLKGLIYGLKKAIEKDYTNILPSLCRLEDFVTDRVQHGPINAILSARVPAENLAVLRRNLQRVLREVFNINTFPCSPDILLRNLLPGNQNQPVLHENENIDLVSNPWILAIKNHLIKFYNSFKCGDDDCSKRGDSKRGGSKRCGSKRCGSKRCGSKRRRRKSHPSRKL